MMRTNIGDAMAQGVNQEAFGQAQAMTFSQEPGFLDLTKTAETVVFLCSEAGSQITGACVEVDRGWTAW